MSVNETKHKENSHNTKIKESWSPKQNTKGEIECYEGEYNFRDALFVIRAEQSSPIDAHLVSREGSYRPFPSGFES